MSTKSKASVWIVWKEGRGIDMIILIQSVTIQFSRLFFFFFDKLRIRCDRAMLLQSVSSIFRCDRLLLQAASGTTKCDRLY